MYGIGRHAYTSGIPRLGPSVALVFRTLYLGLGPYVVVFVLCHLGALHRSVAVCWAWLWSVRGVRIQSISTLSNGCYSTITLLVSKRRNIGIPTVVKQSLYRCSVGQQPATEKRACMNEAVAI